MSVAINFTFLAGFSLSEPETMVEIVGLHFYEFFHPCLPRDFTETKMEVAKSREILTRKLKKSLCIFQREPPQVLRGYRGRLYF